VDLAGDARSASVSVFKVVSPPDRQPPADRSKAVSIASIRLASRTPANRTPGDRLNFRSTGSRLNRASIRIVPNAGARSLILLTRRTTSLTVPITGQSMVCSTGIQSDRISRGIRWRPDVPLISIAAVICRAWSRSSALTASRTTSI